MGNPDREIFRKMGGLVSKWPISGRLSYFVGGGLLGGGGDPSSWGNWIRRSAPSVSFLGGVAQREDAKQPKRQSRNRGGGKFRSPGGVYLGEKKRIVTIEKGSQDSRFESYWSFWKKFFGLKNGPISTKGGALLFRSFLKFSKRGGKKGTESTVKKRESNGGRIGAIDKNFIFWENSREGGGGPLGGGRGHRSASVLGEKFQGRSKGRKKKKKAHEACSRKVFRVNLEGVVFYLGDVHLCLAKKSFEVNMEPSWEKKKRGKKNLVGGDRPKVAPPKRGNR